MRKFFRACKDAFKDMWEDSPSGTIFGTLGFVLVVVLLVTLGPLVWQILLGMACIGVLLVSSICLSALIVKIIENLKE